MVSSELADSVARSFGGCFRDRDVEPARDLSFRHWAIAFRRHAPDAGFARADVRGWPQ